MNEKVDVIIIGAGSAGLAALREVEKTTRNVVMINDGAYGTTCARVGCMPSKALIEIAKAFHARHKHEAFGIRGSDALTVDLPAVMRRVRSLRDRFVAGTLEATNALGERSIAGRARLRGPHQVEVAGRVFEARRIIIATGSRPRLLPPWQALGERVLTTDSIFELATLPRRVAIIGLGAIGIECAQALSRLGVEVSAFGQDQSLAGISDDKVNATLRTILDREFTIQTGDNAELSTAGEGVRVRAGETVLEVDRVLAAIGRVPNVDDLGLETLGVALDEHGMPPYDPETTQIADLPVFLAGDANGHAPLLHEAADEGYIAGVNAVAAGSSCFQRRTPLGIVFAEPAVAFVGQRFGELPAQGVAIGEVSFARQGRAVTAQRNEGLMRIYASRDDARLLGAEMCAPAAEHMAHFLALAVGQGLTPQELLRTPFYHPVLEEGLRTALRDLARQFEHRSSDLAACNAFQVEALD
ncbi:MAG: dihydrolipoyl dehydrogenase [Gammaproteobacteria bacterium]